jgi:SAM-dependent methyltransferase
MNSWIARQMEQVVSQFDGSLETHYRDSAHFFRNPEDFYRGITELWNYLDAVKQVDWDRYLKPGSQVLDLAGGTGWLSAHLSQFEQIAKIYNVDSSRYFLSLMMPGLVRLMHGKPEKIEPIEGLFTPLFFEDSSLDAVVVSSSLHHADSLETVLNEVHRVLKSDGLLFILNETPASNLRYVLGMVRQFTLIMRDTLLRRYRPVSPSLSSSGSLYDPLLGDKAYPTWYWKKSIERSRFELAEFIDTGLLTVKTHRRGISLSHFICRKA